MSASNAAPLPIKLLALVLVFFGLLAFFGSLFMWGQGFLLTAAPGSEISFPVTDIVVNAPATLVAAYGLWRMRNFGIAAGLFVAGFYIYASVYIFTEILASGPPYPFEIWDVQVLAVLAAIALVFLPRRYQDRFH